jgi:hypothetical protein
MDGDPDAGPKYEAGLRLGPDSAGQIVCWVGIPGAVFLAVAWSYILPLAAGGFVCAWGFAVWYAWRSGFRSLIMIDKESLRVVTPLRTFVTPWSCVRKVQKGSHIVVTTDSKKFRIPQYSATSVSKGLSAATPMFWKRNQLEDAMDQAMQLTPKDSSTHAGQARVDWIVPSKLYVVLLVVASVAVETWTIASIH